MKSALLIAIFGGLPLLANSMAEIQAFMDRHCYECHDEDLQKGDRRLDDLTADDYGVWQTVHDLIETGDMPPHKKGRVRPDPESVAAVLNAIGNEMRKRPQTPALRRMNRREYENTLHDLLGIRTPLAEILPEDSSVQGFDNVGDGLSISSELMGSYLEAANAAFDGVIRRHQAPGAGHSTSAHS